MTIANLGDVMDFIVCAKCFITCIHWFNRPVRAIYVFAIHKLCVLIKKIGH